MKIRPLAWTLPLTAATMLGLTGCPAPADAPRNVILMVADGAGFQHVDAANLWSHGRRGCQPYERFPVRTAVDTHHADAPPYDPEAFWTSLEVALERPTDSAAAATALGCGVKTEIRMLGVTPDGAAAPSFLELAHRRGLATGVVSTVLFSHATPAGLLVHHPDRNDYQEIARRILRDGFADVVMGAGHPLYDHHARPDSTPDYRFVGGVETWDLLRRADAPLGWTVIETREDFRGLAHGPAPARVLGLPRVRETLQQQRPGDPHAEPFAEPLREGIPTLTEMSLAALNVLGADPDGFALMIEGGAVDWAAHEHQIGRMVEEMIDFNRAVAAVIDWIESHGGWDETLLIVTADHETGYLHAPGLRSHAPLPSRGPGTLPEAAWSTDGHSNSLVPLYARGAGALALLPAARMSDPIRGWYLDNTEVGRLLCRWAEGSDAARAAERRVVAGF